MFSELIKFFGSNPDATVFNHEDEDYCSVVLSTRGMSQVPALNDEFRVGPYIFKCIQSSGRFVVGYIHASAL